MKFTVYATRKFSFTVNAKEDEVQEKADERIMGIRFGPETLADFEWADEYEIEDWEEA